MRETQLAKKIARYIRERGGWATKIHGGPQQTRGLPDVIFCYQGMFGGLEVKLPGKEKTLTVNQERTLTKIEEAGGTAKMVTSVAQVRRILDELECE